MLSSSFCRGWPAIGHAAHRAERPLRREAFRLRAGRIEARGLKRFMEKTQETEENARAGRSFLFIAPAGSATGGGWLDAYPRTAAVRVGSVPRARASSRALLPAAQGTRCGPAESGPAGLRPATRQRRSARLWSSVERAPRPLPCSAPVVCRRGLRRARGGGPPRHPPQARGNRRREQSPRALYLASRGRHQPGASPAANVVLRWLRADGEPHRPHPGLLPEASEPSAMPGLAGDRATMG